MAGGSATWGSFTSGMLLYGAGQTILALRAGHLASHGGLCRSSAANRFWSWMLVEVVGSFSVRVGREIHLVEHHPHTNIIGRGDSSTWRAPFLPRSLYFFVAPLTLSPLTPVVAVAQLWGRWRPLLSFAVSAGLGLGASLAVLVLSGACSPWTGLAWLFLARAPYQLPYLHFNVFQHIGLPMFHPEARPPRLLQMSAGVLNLCPNPLLLLLFGHSLIDCHVEHHLFPRLSDDQCAKVRPAVRKFLTQRGLPYNEKPYMERLTYFFKNYQSLLVNAPPLTRFVGLQ